MDLDFATPASPVASARTQAAIAAFTEGLLTYGPQAAEILGAARADPGSRLANLYAGALYMLFESEAGLTLAAGRLTVAEAAPAGDDREARLTDFLRAWIADDIPQALRISAAIVAAWPRDLVAVKLHQYLAFNRGDFPAMLRIALAALPANRDVAPLHAMLAFGYEQCHLLAEAEAAARQALALHPAEPWAQHALAHVMLTEGRIDEGADFMAAAAPGWDRLNSFIYTHNWWHLALFRLSQGRLDEVLEIYDRHCWARDHDYSQDQVGAVSLLARMEFAGIDVGDRWAAVAEPLAARAGDTGQPFLALQYLYGLARAGRPEAGALMAAIETRAAAAPAHARDAWREAALPAARSIMAFIAEDYPTAVRLMDAALPRMAEIGGSHAQRDLFEQIHLEGLLRAGRFVDAQQVLEVRRGFDPDSAPLNLMLGRVYGALGLPDLAAQAESRAQSTLERRPP